MKNRITALLLIIVLVLTSLYGCSKESNMTTGQLGNQDNKINKKDLDNTTMGRYMEEKIALPELKGNDSEIIKILQNNEKQIEVYAYSDGQYVRYQLQKDNSWKSSVPEWLNNDTIRNSNQRLLDLCIGNDGNYYGTFTDYDLDTPDMLIKSINGIGVEKLKIAYLEEKKGKGDFTYYPTIAEIQALENGNIILFDTDSWRDDKLIVCSSDGTEIDKLRIGVKGNSKTKHFIAKENKIIALNEDGSGIMFYNPAERKEERTIEFTDDDSFISFALKKDGTLLMGNGSGIHRLPVDGSLWETTVDGTPNSMSMPTLSFENLYVTEGEPEEYYAVYKTEEYEYELMHYVFDENVKSVPSKEITVYSLKENKTIRQAIALFQYHNTDVRVNYLVAMGDDVSNAADYIRALNTELLAGNGADILVLDGLPADSYIEKGVLADISDIISSLEETEDLLTNITECYIIDGKSYKFPVRFSMPVIVGDHKAIQASTSLNSILDYIHKNGTKPYLSETTYKELLADCLALYSKDLFENNKLKEDNFITFLRAMKELADNCHATETKKDHPEFDEKELLDYNDLFDGEILSIPKKAEVSMFQIQNIYDTILKFVAIRDKELEIQSINKSFIPVGMIGLNSKAQEPEIAKQFIHFLLEREVQDMIVYDGFPVNKVSLEAWIKRDNVPIMYGESNEDGDEIYGEWPEKEERELIHKMILDLKYPIDMDFMLNQIIINSSLPHLKGEVNESQVIAEVTSKINTYLAE